MSVFGEERLPETLPIHCAACGQPVTVQYRLHPVLGAALETDNEYLCPYCDQTVDIRLPGELIDWWSGHRDDPAR